MEIDPMREIRTIRRKICEECGNDPDKVFDYYQARQEELRATGKYEFVTKPLDRVAAGLPTEQRDERES